MSPSVPRFAAALLLVCSAGCDARTPAPRPPRSAHAAAAAPRYDDFNRFWTAFRSATLARDYAAIATLTAFPVEQRGLLDDSPSARINRKGFAAAFDRALHDDSGMNAPTPVALAEVRAKLRFDRAEIMEGQVSFGSFDFRRTAAGWKLVTLSYGE